MRKKTGVFLGTAALVALGAAAFAQNAGSFSEAQVTAGRQAYANNCAQCHNPDLSGTNDAPQLAGSAFFGAWKGRTTEALYNKISKTMPAGRGGSLDEATYASIVAYVLHANGAAAGAAALNPASTATIGSIASGKVSDDVLHPPVASRPMAVPGSLGLPTKFGLMLEGHIENYVPAATIRAGATARSKKSIPRMSRS